MKLMKHKYLLGAAAIALAIPAVAGGARADDQLDAVLKRLERLEKENAKLKTEISKIETKTAKPGSKVTTASGSPNGNPNFVNVAIPRGSYGAGTAAENVNYSYKDGGEDDDWWIHHKPGSPSLTFQTPNGEITAYGRLNLTVQDATPGTAGFTCLPPICGLHPQNNSPVGNMGWMPSVASPNSYVGLRGEQYLGNLPFKFVYQLETSIDFSAQSGVSETNSKASNVVSGGLTTRNTYMGFSSDTWGSIKGGKTTAPYANSTAMMNPFAGLLGNYNVIMGNTGGDNRSEFNTRLDHAIWYESPVMKAAGGAFNFAALVSPGQNRSNTNDNIAAGESDCTGGNSPESGGFGSCSDGSYGTAYSVSGTYQTKISLGGGGLKDVPDEIGVLVTGAYEMHKNVNRQSDILGVFGAGVMNDVVSPATLDSYALGLYNQDIADEDAWKIGMQLKFPTKTTVSAIFESMHRYVPQDLVFQNERQRNGTWFSVTQDITDQHNVAFGWGHAFRTPGDPCQHNDCVNLPTDPLGNGYNYATNHNAADMLTAAWFYKFSPGWTWFLDYAITINEESAHYDLAQGGGAATTDCHDASGALGGTNGYGNTSGTGQSNPHCWTGGILQGVQTGVRYQF
ncbi:MAG: hypothetical protein WBX25_10215 [Rhodomicrobium sp.]